jgi:hypothetical protein
LAGAPGILDAYQQLHELFVNSSFNEEELTVVWQSISRTCLSLLCTTHTGIAAMMKVDETITEALRNETPLANPKLEAFTYYDLINCSQPWSCC